MLILKKNTISFSSLGGFHPKDIERIKTTEIWLQRFLEQHDIDMKASLNMLWETCEWRKNYGTNGRFKSRKSFPTRKLAELKCDENIFVQCYAAS